MKRIKPYPIEKYKITVNGNVVSVESSFAGSAVVGRAKCDPQDTFDQAKGIELAAARCNAKVAEKRLKRAEDKLRNKQAVLLKAMLEIEKAAVYVADARSECMTAKADLNKIEAVMKGEK